MRQVYTYRSIERLNEHPCAAKIMRYPHITATHDYVTAYRERYTAVKGLVDVHELQKALLCDWEDAGTSFQQFIMISQALRNIDGKMISADVYNSFVKNKVLVLNAIRLLVEADVSPDDIDPLDSTEKLFKSIWTELEIIDDSFGEFRFEMEAYKEEPREFKSILHEVAPELDADTIILDGFYFITPIQERIFEFLERQGKQLIFLCCMDDTVPEIEEIWYKVLCSSAEVVSPDKWVSDGPCEVRNQAFGSAFGGAPHFCKQPHISIVEYRNEMEFVRDIDWQLKHHIPIFSTDVKATDELLKEFYPDSYKRRHLLSYPVGQYIYRLHSMWDESQKSIAMSFEDVQACFSSGWVEVDGINGIDYCASLEKLKTYVGDCSTLDQWEKRLNQLQQTVDTVLGAFEAGIADVSENHKRWHRMMADPFLNFSCFSLDSEQVKQIVKLINHLIYTAKTLFAESGEISISGHLKKVRELIAKKSTERELLEEENAVITELNLRLSRTDWKTDRCFSGDIADAIMLVIGGGILDEDTYEFQSGNDKSLFRALYQIETAPITCKGRVHLCLADEHKLPGKKKPYVWPLSDGFLDRLRKTENNPKCRYLKDMRFIMDNQPLANRYLFFSLLQNSNVELSWISSQDNKLVAASPYLQILERLFDVEVRHPDEYVMSDEMIESIPSASVPLQMRVDFDKELAMEPQMDLVLCPWRYIYGYILSDIPTYTTQFHYTFAITNLISAVTQVMDCKKKEAAEQILPLFPYLREVEKRQAQDYIKNLTDEGTDTLDYVSYPIVRLYTHFLNDAIKQKARAALENQLGVASKCYADLVHVGSYDLCMYCPFSSSCPYGKHHKEEA